MNEENGFEFVGWNDFELREGAVGDLFVKMDIASAVDDLFADRRDNAGKFIRADMRMCIVTYIFRCAKMNEQLKNTVDITSFITTSI